MDSPLASDAPDGLFEGVYQELKAIARHRLAAERRDHTLQATALVHETYLRLIQRPGSGVADKATFYAAAAQAMRRILIEHARRRGRLKRGREWKRVSLDGVSLAADGDLEQIMAVDDAIRRLEEEDPRAANVIRLRYYAGLSVDEAAQALGVAPRTAARDWEYARAWLADALREEGD